MNLLTLGLFSFGGGARTPIVAPAPTPPPSTPEAIANDPVIQEAKQKEKSLLMRRSGRGSTILTGPAGLTTDTGKKTLLGQ